MTIDDVVERATINFPALLNAEGVEEMFLYLHHERNFAIDYALTSSKKVGNSYTRPQPDDKAMLTGIKISGAIHNINAHDTDFFECSSTFDPEMNSLITGLRFMLIPGYEIEEYRRGTIALWDKVREGVADYFKCK